MKLNLGCGFHPMKGWTNYDVVSCKDVYICDISKGLPFRGAHMVPAPGQVEAYGTVDFIYAEHFLEHITHHQAEILMRDCLDALKPGGVIRISTPDLWKLVQAYLKEQLDIWGGAWKPKTKAQMLNEGMSAWGHKFMYDLPELTGLLYEAGFSKVYTVRRHESEYPELRGLELRGDMGELIVEGLK